MLVVISNAFLFKTESNSQSPTPGCVRHDQNIHLQTFPIWDQVRKDSSSDKTIQIKIREMLLCVWVFACGVCACLHCIQFQLRNQHNHEVMFKNKILFCNNHCPYFLRLQCSQPITQATAFFSITTCNLFVSPKSILLPALPAILFEHAVHSLFVVQCRNIFFSCNISLTVTLNPFVQISLFRVAMFFSCRRQHSLRSMFSQTLLFRVITLLCRHYIIYVTLVLHNSLFKASQFYCKTNYSGPSQFSDKFYFT